ncbi:hypothetical protein ACKWTF_000988 [Chironomus riparius]
MEKLKFTLFKKLNPFLVLKVFELNVNFRCTGNFVDSCFNLSNQLKFLTNKRIEDVFICTSLILQFEYQLLRIRDFCIKKSKNLSVVSDLISSFYCIRNCAHE